MARPRAMMIATMPSMRSVDLSLAGLRLPAGSWATATFAAIQRATGLPPWASFFETISFSSSRVGAAIERKPWRNLTVVAPSSRKRSAMWVAFQGSYAISRTSNSAASARIRCSMAP
jgi:hypothetical protein